MFFKHLTLFNTSCIFLNITSNNIDTLYNIYHNKNIINNKTIYQENNIISNINECYSCNNIISQNKSIIRAFDKSFCSKYCLLNPYIYDDYKNNTSIININKEFIESERNIYVDIYKNLFDSYSINKSNLKRINNDENIDEDNSNIFNIKLKIKFIHKLKGFISILIRLNKNANLFNKLFIVLITLSILFYHKHISHTIK